MSDTREVQVVDAGTFRTELMPVEKIKIMVGQIRSLLSSCMEKDMHYGVIPGCQKPSLWKPGAELLCVLFRLDPQYSDPPRLEREGDHLTVISTCTLWHIPTGQRMGSGQGSCSTRESKYAYRTAARVCPKCGQPAIIKGKEEYGGGWVCFKKKEGCGAKFADEDAAITGQVVGRVANEDLADQENTILKMSNKRALVAAVLNVTAASDIFTQDLEDSIHSDVPGPLRKGEVLSGAGDGQTNPDTAGSTSASPRGQALSSDAEKDVLLGRIQAGMDKLTLSAHARVTLWEQYCPQTVFCSHEPDIAALGDLLADLQKQYKSKK